jgi:hypothetical protein
VVILTDRPHPNGKSGRISVQARDDPEYELFRKFKRILAIDGVALVDFFMPIIRETVIKRDPANPQTILDPTKADWHSMSRAQETAREKLGPRNTYNLWCPFCGDYFDTTEDMPMPTCPKCRKPEAAT